MPTTTWTPEDTEDLIESLADEHVFPVLVAFDVLGPTPEAAQQRIVDVLACLDLVNRHGRRPDHETICESWHVAEDVRVDNSDSDSAVFCITGRQEQATRLLRAAGLAH